MSFQRLIRHKQSKSESVHYFTQHQNVSHNNIKTTNFFIYPSYHNKR